MCVCVGEPREAKAYGDGRTSEAVLTQRSCWRWASAMRSGDSALRLFALANLFALCTSPFEVRTHLLRVIGGPGLSILPGFSARSKEHPGCKMWYHLTYLTPHPSARSAHRLVWSRMAGRTAEPSGCKSVSTTSEISLRAATWSTKQTMTTAQWPLCRYIEGRVCRLQGAVVYKTQD